MLRTENFKPGKGRSSVRRAFLFFLKILVLTVLVRFFLFEGYSQKGLNMFPSAAPGDAFLVNRFVFGIRIPPFRSARFPAFSSPGHGDFVLYYHPGMDTPSGLRILLDYVSLGILADSGRGLNTGRIAACPGDRIRLDRQGRLFRNGKLLTAPGGKVVGLRYRYDGRRVSLYYGEMKIASRASAFKGAGERTIRAVRAMEGGYPVLLRERTGMPFPPDITRSSAVLEGFVNSFLAGNLPFRDGLPVMGREDRAAKGVSCIRYSVKPDGGLVIRHPDFDRPFDLIRSEGGRHWLVIPDGYYFILNDNRLLDTDSRSFGLVPKGRIEGSYLFRVAPAGGQRPL